MKLKLEFRQLLIVFVVIMFLVTVIMFELGFFDEITFLGL